MLDEFWRSPKRGTERRYFDERIVEYIRTHFSSRSSRILQFDVVNSGQARRHYLNYCPWLR